VETRVARVFDRASRVRESADHDAEGPAWTRAVEAYADLGQGGGNHVGLLEIPLRIRRGQRDHLMGWLPQKIGE